MLYSTELISLKSRYLQVDAIVGLIGRRVLAPALLCQLILLYLNSKLLNFSRSAYVLFHFGDISTALTVHSQYCCTCQNKLTYHTPVTTFVFSYNSVANTCQKDLILYIHLHSQ